uniref:Lrp/AsnC family transcriptional regulator n=1 Tax=Thermofilum pendens TaxID=2269 RepID=A0A7C1TB05_THEPE
MVTGYVLITTRPGREYDVASELRKIPNVVDVDVTYGLWDIIAKIEAPSLVEFDRTLAKIRELRDIEQTATLVSHT